MARVCERSVVAWAAALLVTGVGCDSEVVADPGLEDELHRSHTYCRRRNDYPTLLAVGDLDLSGNPSISGSNARLAANGTITIAGSADVEAEIASGGDLIIHGNPSIDGNVETFSHTLQVADDPYVDFAPAYNHNWRIPCVVRNDQCRRELSGTSLELRSNETLTLQTGVYYFSEVQISGQAALQTIGNVWIYVDGGASFNGGATWNSNWDTLTLVSGSEDTITINGASSAAMHVFAPHATVKLAGTSGFAGSVVAHDIVLSGTTDLWLTAGSIAKNCPPLDGRYNG